MNTIEASPLAFAEAYKGVLQVLACDLFAPGSCSIHDPRELNVIRARTAITVEEQDRIRMTAQNLARHLFPNSELLRGYDYCRFWSTPIEENSIRFIPPRKAFPNLEQDVT